MWDQDASQWNITDPAGGNRYVVVQQADAPYPPAALTAGVPGLGFESIVTAISFGGCSRVARQRARSTISAVESGPPDTATTNAGKESKARNSQAASASETGDASSAFDASLLTLDALSDRH